MYSCVYISNLASVQLGLLQSARLRHLYFFVVICYFWLNRYQNCRDDRSLECTIPSARANAVRAGLDKYQIDRAEWIPGDYMNAAYHINTKTRILPGLRICNIPSPNIHPGSISSWMPIISALPRPYTIWYINIWEAQCAESSIRHPLIPTNHLC